MPAAIGAAQLTQTPKGVPIAIPSALLPRELLKLRRRNSANKVINAEANKTPNVIPFLLVSIQLTVVYKIRVSTPCSGRISNTVSKPKVSIDTSVPIAAFSFNCGTREPDQKLSAKLVIRINPITMRLSSIQANMPIPQISAIVYLIALITTIESAHKVSMQYSGSSSPSTIFNVKESKYLKTKR